MTNKDLHELEIHLKFDDSVSVDDEKIKDSIIELFEDFKFLKSKVGLQTFNLMLDSCSSFEEKCRLYTVFGIDPCEYFGNDFR